MIKIKPKMLFAIDNGIGTQLKGSGLAADYYPISDTIIWRKLDENRILKQRSLSDKISSFIWMALPFLIVPTIALLGGYSRDYIYPWKNLGLFSFLLPIILGILIYISFEMCMSLLRNTYIQIEAPSALIQKEYFESINEITLKHNDVLSQIKTPYIVNIVVFSIIIFIVTPFVFWFYFFPGTIVEYMLKLLILGILISLIPNILWNGILKAIMTRKILNKIDKELGEKNE